MEVLFGAVTAAMLAYILSEIKLARKQINDLENRVIRIELKIPKRKDDGELLY